MGLRNSDSDLHYYMKLNLCIFLRLSFTDRESILKILLDEKFFV